jgi:hypothetical protein
VREKGERKRERGEGKKRRKEEGKRRRKEEGKRKERGRKEEGKRRKEEKERGRKEEGKRKERGRKEEGKRKERGWKEDGKRMERGWKEDGKRMERGRKGRDTLRDGAPPRGDENTAIFLEEHGNFEVFSREKMPVTNVVPHEIAVLVWGHSGLQQNPSCFVRGSTQSPGKTSFPIAKAKVAANRWHRHSFEVFSR